MSFFGAVFAALTMSWHGVANGALLATPFLVFGLFAMAAVHVIRLPGKGFRLTKKVERVIAWSSVGEGVGLFIAGNVVMNLHRPDLLLPSMALIVALHFVPIAIATMLRPYFILAAALVAAAATGFVLSSPVGGEVAGFTAAACLWVASAIAVWRDWRNKARPSSSSGAG